MKKRFTMLLASMFLCMGAWAQVYQKIPHTKWTVTALNQAGVQGNEGGIDYLKDENPETFYHSDYSNSYSDGNSGKKKGQDGLQAFMVELPEVMPIDKITYKGRSNGGNNWATKARIYVFETLPDGWPKDGEAVKQLSAMTYAEKEGLLKRTDNTVLGTPAFDNNDNGTWAADQNIKTAEFSSTLQGKYILFVADATTGTNGYLCCGDFHLWQKIEGVVSDKPYYLKISGLDNYYLDIKEGVSSDYGRNTVSKSETPVAAYFTLNNGYWHISSLPGDERNFVGVGDWDATPGQPEPTNWTLHSNGADSWSLAQSMYYGNNDASKHYLGANNGDISGQTKLYTDKSLAQAVKFELVELDEKQTVAEAARVALSYTGVGYPAADSEARTTLQAAMDAADATVGSINEAIAEYQTTQAVLLPEVGKVYRLISGLSGFETKKAIYSDNIELKWKDKDVDAMNQLWVVLSVSGSDIALMNIGDAMFPQKSDFQKVVKMSAVKNECSIEFLGKGQWGIKANKQQGMHANGHSNGAGLSGSIINYNTGVDGASAWCFEEVAVTEDILRTQIESVENTYMESLLIKQDNLAELHAAVDEARSNDDYAAALVNIATAMDAAVIAYIDMGYFYMKSKDGQQYAYNDGNNLRTKEDKVKQSIFKFIKADDTTFYIQNGNGFYAQTSSQSAQTKTTDGQVKFTINKLSDGYYVLRAAESDGARTFWHQDGSSNIVGWSSDAGNTRWMFEALTELEITKIYTVEEFCTDSEDVYVTYTGAYDGDKDVQQAGGFYVLDEAPQSSDFTIANIDNGKVAIINNSLYVCEGYDATKIYTLRCQKGNSYARYHSECQLSEADNTNMLTYENNNLHFESLFYIEEGENDYVGYYTIRSVAAPTMYAYNLKTANENSTVAMKEAPAEGDLTSAYYWRISNFGSKETSNITPWGDDGDKYGWNKRGSYSGYNHIGYWQGGNGTEDNKWYVNIVKDELVEKFIPLYTLADSVVGYATYESVEALLPYTEVVTAEGLNKLKNAQFNVVAPQVGKYYRLKNAASGLYMAGDESHITLVDKEHTVSNIFYLDENYALKVHNTGRYLDCNAKDYAEGDNKPAGTFGFAYNGMEANVITYKNNGFWTYGANSKGDNLLDRGESTPNKAGYNWILEEGDVDVWEAKAELVSLMESLRNPWAQSLPLQVANETEKYFLSSCGSADNNVEGYMIDGKNETFYGSPWASAVADVDYQYWQVDLGDGVSLGEFVFSYVTRANGNDTPYSLVVKGSADGSTFGVLETISEGLPQDGGSEYISSVISNPNNYRYIRFEVTDARKGSGANPGYAAGGHATQRTFALAEFAMWPQSKQVFDDAQAVIDNPEATLDEINEAYINLKMVPVEKPVYPFTVTTDDANPVLYAIKSGRTNDSKEWWYTYDSSDGKIALSQYTGDNTQCWFFKQVITDDYQYALQLYPAADATKAMSYQNTNSEAGTIVAQVPGTEGYTNLWLLATTDNQAPYGLQTYNKANYLSNNGGYKNKMGMWNASPKDDGGTAMYFSNPAEYLQALITKAEEMAEGEGTAVGYYTSASVANLKTAIETAKANLDTKNYSVEALNEAVAALEIILPESGKYYQIHSGYQEFSETKAIYSTDTAPAWKSLDNLDKTFYWTITPNVEGTSYTFQNVGNNGYLNGVTIVTQDTVTTTLKFLAPGEFNIISNGQTLHANNHLNGGGVSGTIINYGGGANGASSWKIIEVEHPDLVNAKAALQNKVDELNARIANSGTNPGYYDSNETSQLVTPVATAQSVLEGGSKDAKTYIDALDALNHAIEGVDLELLIPVAAGKYFIVNAKPEFNDTKVLAAHTVCGWYGTASTPGWAEKVSNDPLQYWEIEVEDEKFYLKSAYEGSYVTSVNTLGNERKEVTFTWLDPGQYNILVNEEVLHANLHGSGVSSSNIVNYAGGAHSPSAWKLIAVTEKPEFTYDLTVGATGYATLMLGYDATIPPGVACYTVKVEGSDAVLTAVKDVLPANTPVVVKAEEGTYSFASSDEHPNAIAGNALKGSLYPKLITPDVNTTCYVLSKPKAAVGESENPLGFYPVKLGRDRNGATVTEGGTSFMNNANRIYLPVEVSAQKAPRSLIFRFGDTGVEDMQAVPQHTLIYDLMGRPVERMEKGIYIVNGRKVVK